MRRQFFVGSHRGRHCSNTIRVDHNESTTGGCLVASTQVGYVHARIDHPLGSRFTQAVTPHPTDEMRGQTKPGTGDGLMRSLASIQRFLVAPSEYGLVS